MKVKNQTIVKIDEDIYNNFDSIISTIKYSKSKLIELKMKEFIKLVNENKINPIARKKVLAVEIDKETYREFKSKCKEVNYGIGESLDILISDFNKNNSQKNK